MTTTMVFWAVRVYRLHGPANLAPAEKQVIWQETERISTTPSASTRTIRYHGLDWLRVLATLAVFVYNAAKPFNFDAWHIRKAQLSPALDSWAGFLGVWRMPAFFVLSGTRIALSLRSRSAGQLARGGITRLMIPLIFGIFVLSLHRSTSNGSTVHYEEE